MEQDKVETVQEFDLEKVPSPIADWRAKEVVEEPDYEFELEE